MGGTKKPERDRRSCSGRNTNFPRCHPYSKLSFLSRTSYACDITVTPVGAYAAKSLRSALGSPFTKLTYTAIAPSAALCSSNAALLLFLKGYYSDIILGKSRFVKCYFRFLQIYLQTRSSQPRRRTLSSNTYGRASGTLSPRRYARGGSPRTRRGRLSCAQL